MKKARGRPPKPDRERKDVDLRIPVTVDQKELIVRVAQRHGEDMAAWARRVLLAAAREEESTLDDAQDIQNDSRVSASTK